MRQASVAEGFGGRRCASFVRRLLVTEVRDLSCSDFRPTANPHRPIANLAAVAARLAIRRADRRSAMPINPA
jgi:hypothetical protein